MHTHSHRCCAHTTLSTQFPQPRPCCGEALGSQLLPLVSLQSCSPSALRAHSTDVLLCLPPCTSGSPRTAMNFEACLLRMGPESNPKKLLEELWEVEVQKLRETIHYTIWSFDLVHSKSRTPSEREPTLCIMSHIQLYWRDRCLF